MKSIVLSGQATRAYCPSCQSFQAATYAYGDFPFDNGLVAQNVMRATCDQCHQIIALAHQSAPVLKATLAEPKTTTTMRLPAELLDFVSLQLDRAGVRPNHYDLFLRALLAACRGKEESLAAPLQELQDPVLEQPNNKTINLSFHGKLQEVLNRLLVATRFENVSELLRRLIVLAESPTLAKPVAQETSRLALALT